MAQNNHDNLVIEDINFFFFFGFFFLAFQLSHQASTLECGELAGWVCADL